MTIVNAGSKPAVIVFVRAPEPGRVKTRLAAAIGAEAALRVYRALAEHTLREAETLRADGVEIRVHYTPAEAEEAVRGWLGADATYLPQAEGDLGARMEDAFVRAFAAGARQVVIVGSDLPALSADLLRRAFHALDLHPAVLGPARDGGYYLLGLTGLIPEIFHGVAWSTPSVLTETLERLRAAGIHPPLLEELADVDVVEDLEGGWISGLDPDDSPVD